MHVFWDLTRECNLKCVHCYNAPQRAVAPPDVNTRAKLDIVKSVSEKYPGAVLHLLGGEPTLTPDFLLLVDVAARAGLQLEITTNGCESSRALLDVIRNEFFRVHLSLDGTNAETNDKIRGRGVFEKALCFLEAWNSRPMPAHASLDLSFTLTRQAVDQARSLVEFCLAHKFQSLTIQPVKLMGNAERSAKNFGITATEYLQFGCDVARYSVGENLVVRVTGGSMRMKEHIKWTYFNDVVSVEAGCDAATGQLRINSTGSIEPCIAAALLPEAVVQEIDISALQPNSKFATSARSNLNSKASRLHEINRSGQPSICTECTFHLERKCYGGCAVQRQFGPAMLCNALIEFAKEAPAHDFS